MTIASFHYGPDSQIVEKKLKQRPVFFHINRSRQTNQQAFVRLDVRNMEYPSFIFFQVGNILNFLYSFVFVIPAAFQSPGGFSHPVVIDGHLALIGAESAGFLGCRKPKIHRG